MIDVLILGAGQCGLGTVYRLRQRTGLSVRVLEGGEVAQSWLDRWESLRLFTPPAFSSPPGLAFPGGVEHCPTRDQTVQYLQGYAARFELPVETRVRVHRLSRDAGAFTAQTSAGLVRARQVVLATGAFGLPRLPAAAAQLDRGVWQLHSGSYRSRHSCARRGHGLGGSTALPRSRWNGLPPIGSPITPRLPWYVPPRGHGRRPVLVAARHRRPGRLVWCAGIQVATAPRRPDRGHRAALRRSGPGRCGCWYSGWSVARGAEGCSVMEAATGLSRSCGAPVSGPRPSGSTWPAP